MVTFQLDIFYSSIKFSQDRSSPAIEHHDAIKQIHQNIKATKSDGIYFWGSNSCNNLPDLPLPQHNVNNIHAIDSDARITNIQVYTLSNLW